MIGFFKDAYLLCSLLRIGWENHPVSQRERRGGFWIQTQEHFRLSGSSSKNSYHSTKVPCFCCWKLRTGQLLYTHSVPELWWCGGAVVGYLGASIIPLGCMYYQGMKSVKGK